MVCSTTENRQENLYFFHLSEAAIVLCHLLLIGYDTNKQWAMVGVVLYSKKYLLTNEVKDFCFHVLEKNFKQKEETDFMYIR